MKTRTDLRPPIFIILLSISSILNANTNFWEALSKKNCTVVLLVCSQGLEEQICFVLFVAAFLLLIEDKQSKDDDTNNHREGASVVRVSSLEEALILVVVVRTDGMDLRAKNGRIAELTVVNLESEDTIDIRSNKSDGVNAISDVRDVDAVIGVEHLELKLKSRSDERNPLTVAVLLDSDAHSNVVLDAVDGGSDGLTSDVMLDLRGAQNRALSKVPGSQFSDELTISRRSLLRASRSSAGRQDSIQEVVGKEGQRSRDNDASVIASLHSSDQVSLRRGESRVLSIQNREEKTRRDARRGQSLRGSLEKNVSDLVDAKDGLEARKGINDQVLMLRSRNIVVKMVNNAALLGIFDSNLRGEVADGAAHSIISCNQYGSSTINKINHTMRFDESRELCTHN